MALGRGDRQGRFDDAALLLGEQLAEGSIYRLLAEHGDVLFVDGYFADLFTGSPWVRPTVPTRVVATVMLLQAHEGLSDREACGNEVERAEVGDELSLEGPLVVEVEVLERLVRGEARGADSFRSPGVRL